MYTVPADAFLQMTEVKMHEELLDAGAVTEFDESMGNAMFVSHQWLSDTHTPIHTSSSCEPCKMR